MTPEQKERALYLLENKDKIHTKMLAALYLELTGIKINGRFCTPASRNSFHELFTNQFNEQLYGQE